MSEATDGPIPTLGELRRQEREEEAQEARDLGKTFRKRINEGGGEFSETIAIKGNGKLDVEDEQGNLMSLFTHLSSLGGPEELYRKARIVGEQCPDLSFNFERDPEGRWIKYSVHPQNKIAPSQASGSTQSPTIPGK